MFSAFVQLSGQSIDLATVKPCDPPAPDIESRYTDGTGVTFEIVELLDRDFKRNSELQLAKTEAFYSHLDKLDGENDHFVSLYHNADILVNFSEGLTQNKIRSLVPSVFQELLALPAGFEGLLNSFKLSRINGTVESISVVRGGFKGPVFNAQSIGWIGDPCVPTVKNKLQ